MKVPNLEVNRIRARPKIEQCGGKQGTPSPGKTSIRAAMTKRKMAKHMHLAHKLTKAKYVSLIYPEYINNVTAAAFVFHVGIVYYRSYDPPLGKVR